MSLQALQRDIRLWLTREPAAVPASLGESCRPGLEVYLNNYRAQLLTCLAASFPVLRAWLGESAFDGAAATHIDRVPPHAWTLDDYACEFPATLAVLYPDDPLIAELAALESGLATAFVGPDANVVEPATLHIVDWDTAVIQLAPTLELLTVTTNAGALWSAINANQTPPAPARLPQVASIAIWRRRYSPAFRTLTCEEATALAQIRAGRPFADVCAKLVDGLGEEPGTQAAGAMLSQWLIDDLIVRIDD
jgi:hypothetical protein